jgi:hypothetical protein
MTTTTQAIDASPGRRVPLVDDTPLHDPALDRFGFAEFARALALIVDDEGTATPLTIAVSAPWGGGKSSLGFMVQWMLDGRVKHRGDDDPRLVCWFNAWEHDDAPHLGAALAAAVARTADRNRSWWRRVVAPLPGAMLRPGERSRQTVMLAAASAAVALGLVLFGPSRDLLDNAFGEPGGPAAGAGVLGVVFFALFVSRRLFTTAREAARFIDDPRSAAAHGSMSEVKEQFGRLIRHATHDGRIVIIIDDLERCASDRALEVCQVASQLLGQPGVVTIVLADMAPIARSAGTRYATTQSGREVADPEEIGRRYLAKIVQLEIALPPPAPDDMRQVIREYGPSLRHPHREAAAEPRLRLRWLALMRRVRASERRVAGTWQAIERAAERAGWWPLLFFVLVAFVYGIVYPDAANSDESDPVSTVGGFGLLASFALGWWARRLRARTRQRRAELKEQIEELKQQQLSPDEIEREVLQRTATEPAVDHALIKDLVSSSFLDSDEFRAVETFIAENPPALPREAKRSFNHAQLLTEIARARHMFGGDPVLTPAHLAKWLVLREQWPALGREIAVEPERLTDLESRNGGGDAPPEVYELLDRGPRLSDVIERLVYFQPADGR